MKYSICIEPIFNELSFEDRVKSISEIGFKTIEFWDPADKNLDKLREECNKYNVSISICTLNNPWGSKRLHEETKVFIQSFEETIPNLRKINCSKVILLTGETEKDRSFESQRAQIVTNLKEAAKIAESENIDIVLESLNSYVDHKDYFLDSSKLGFEIIKEIGSGKVKLLYDIYHMQIMEGNIISSIEKNIELIGHFHSAGVPGRHELYSGELNYINILKAIDNTIYKEFFGIEYWPSTNSEESLIKTIKFLSE
jgi:hydroxypyruvate isomerase